MVIQATQDSLDNLMLTLDQFAAISRLKINYDKSQNVRIGSLRDSAWKLNINKPLLWSTQMKILGITVMANRQKMLEVNYNQLMEKMKVVLDPWRARTGTLIGKIQIVNSLMLSQAVYKLLCLNTPPQKYFTKIRKMVSEFLWDGKKAKIAYKALIKSKVDGSLNLIDLERKDAALKISWVKKAENSDNAWVHVANQLLPLKIQAMFECNLNHKDIKKITIPSDSVFSSIIDAWSSVHFHQPKEKGEIMNQSLWFNSHIIKEKKTIFD